MNNFLNQKKAVRERIQCVFQKVKNEYEMNNGLKVNTNSSNIDQLENMNNLKEGLIIAENELNNIKKEGKRPESLEEFELNDVQKERLLQIFSDDEDCENYLFQIDLRNRDELFDAAARIVVMNQIGSTSAIQRRFSIGYNRAGRIMDQLEAAGIVGQNEGSKARQVLLQDEYALEQFLEYLPQNKLIDYSEVGNLFYKKYEKEIEFRKAQKNKRIIEKQEKFDKEAIKQQLLDKDRRRRLHKEAYNELIEAGELFNKSINNEWKRETIPQEVMDRVWNRDGGRCAKCGSQENLEFDHIIPFSKGGATTYRNMQLMCKKCNIDKSNKIG